MQKIEFKNGHHIDLKTMNFMQNAYIDSINALVSDKQQNFIVAGVDRTTTSSSVTYADGYVVIGGELMEFRGGSYNISDSNKQCYVVKRTETDTNLNSDGQTYEVLVTTYATLGVYESGAILADTLNDYRMRVFMSRAFEMQSISLASNMIVPEDDDAVRFGYISQSNATPKCIMQNNTIAITGVFLNAETQIATASMAVGVVQNYNGPRVSRIPVKLYYYDAQGIAQTVHSYANLYEDGTLSIYNVAESRFTAAIFDGTPILAM